MKNLKRVLSLALSGIMLVGVMAMGASAVDYKDFTDKDEIQHTEAVSTMNLLGVIDGKDTGAFDPKGIVTRAEMAKMITVALNGGKDPVLGTKTVPTFTDIKGDWAESYIEYCASLNIIAGQGDGTFAPKATVTGSQAAKMVLTALGYEAEVYKLIGADWEINTNREANNAGLFDELDEMNPAEGMTRDDAAQLIWNGVQAQMLTKTPTQSITTGEITFEYTPNAGSMLENKFKVYTDYGVLENVDEGKLAIKLDKANYECHSSKNDGNTENYTKVDVDYSDYLGYTVKVLYKANDKVVGVGPVDGNVAYETVRSATTNNNGKVKFGGTSYTLDSLQILTVAHGATGVTKAAGNATDFAENKTSYNTVTFVDNDGDGELEYAVVREIRAGKVTYATSDEVIMAGDSYDPDDDAIADDVKKNGYAVASYSTFTKDFTVEALEEGESTVSWNKDGKARLDGTWYWPNSQITNGDAGKTMNYYVCNGVVVYAKELEGTKSIDNMALILNKNSDAITPTVRIMLADGTKSNVAVDPDTDVDPIIGTVYTFTSSSDGYNFKSLTDGDKLGDYTYVAGLTKVNNYSSDIGAAATITSVGDGTNEFTIADDAIVMIRLASGGSNLGMTVTGKQLKNTFKAIKTVTDNTEITQDVVAFTSKSSGLTRATLIVASIGGTEMPTNLISGNESYGLIVSNAIVEDDKYMTYTIWNGEENVEVKEKYSAASDIANRTQFTLVTYDEIVTDNEIKGVQKKTLTGSDASGALVAGAAVGLADDKLWPTAAAGYDLDNNTVYMYVDTSTTTTADIGKAGGELTLADTTSENATTYIPNIWYIRDANDVKFVLVDVKNKLADAASKGIVGVAATNTTALVSAGDGKATFSKTTGILPGEVITVKIETGSTALAAADTLTLTNAVWADNNAAAKTGIDLAAGKTGDDGLTFSVIATGAGAVSIAYTAG